MKKPVNLLGGIIRDYFTDHLPRLRASSPHTIHSYRDSIVLLLRYVAEQRKMPVAAVDLRVRDLQLIKPFQVRLFGKGRKERYCPLWPETAAVLRSFCKQRKIELSPEAPSLCQPSRPITKPIRGSSHSLPMFESSL